MFDEGGSNHVTRAYPGTTTRPTLARARYTIDNLFVGLRTHFENKLTPRGGHVAAAPSEGGGTVVIRFPKIKFPGTSCKPCNRVTFAIYTHIYTRAGAFCRKRHWCACTRDGTADDDSPRNGPSLTDLNACGPEEGMVGRFHYE